MKKGILLVALITAMVYGYADGGHYVPRAKAPESQEAMIGAMRANQKTGLIDPALMIAAARQAQNTTRSEGDLSWKGMGPNNVGGQTTAVIYDNQNPSAAYIGSKGGGVYKTWNKGITWHSVGDMPLMVSCMVQTPSGVIYVGTGDGMGAQKFNGMNELGYDNSFVGTGIYKIENDVLTQIESTNPTALNEVGDWSFINELALQGNTLIAATGAGLRYTNDGGATWEYAKKDDGTDMTMHIDEVKVGSDGTIVVAAKEKQGSSTIGTLYIGTLQSMTRNTGTDVSPSGLFDVAIAPSEPNTIYVAALESGGSHSGLYYSADKGATWTNVLPLSDYVSLYQDFGLNNHGLAVCPDDPTRFYVLGYNLWEVKRPAEGGVFIAKQLTDGTSSPIFSELHVGLHSLAFNPKNSNEFYVGTDGGIFKLVRRVYSTSEDIIVTNCNRNYITSRFFSVAYSAYKQRVIGGCLDHGTVLIVGDPNNVSLETGQQVYPNMQFAFNSTYYAGYCALSLLNPDALFVTTAGSHIYRSQTMGADFDMSNFTDNLSISSSQGLFRMPFILAEKFDDTRNTDSVWFYSRSTAIPAGTVVKCRSNIAEYPFDYVLPYDLTENDSILVHDPFSAILVLGLSNYIYMTRTPLHFNKLAEWPALAKSSTGFTGTPTSLALSKDQDALFIGTRSNGLYRISNLNDAYDETANISNYAVDEEGNQITDYTFDSVFVVVDTVYRPDTTWVTVNDTVWVLDPETQEPTTEIDTIIEVTEVGEITEVIDHFVEEFDHMDEVAYFAPMLKKIDLVDAAGEVISQCITSVAVDPNDANKVVLTLGNYGNTTYVMYSNNALADEPTFTVKQGNLPLMPVYSSVIEMTTGKVILGTEHGIYMTDDITAAEPNWVAQRNPMGDVPVMELKQQTVNLPKQEFTEFGHNVVVEGTTNQGVIYAATYGRGLYRCDNFILNSPEIVKEEPSAEVNVNVYPNPARESANISFNIEEGAYVTYQVYDITGKMMQDVVVGNCTTGKHVVSLSLNGMATGTYLLRLNQGDKALVTKFLVY